MLGYARHETVILRVVGRFMTGMQGHRVIGHLFCAFSHPASTVCLYMCTCTDRELDQWRINVAQEEGCTVML